jgi:hypothetical protein
LVKVQGQKPVKVLESYLALANELNGGTYLTTVSQKMRTGLSESFGLYTDAKARSRPQAYHHLYEWGAVGNEGARLFRVNGVNHGKANFTMTYSLLPSSKPAGGSGKVFVNKATVMENQITVVIKPTRGGVLRFEVGNKEVFTRKPIVVKNPGGRATFHVMSRTFSGYFQPSAIEANPVYTSILSQATKTIRARAEAAARV